MKRASEKVTQCLLEHPFYLRSKCLSIYISTDTEVIEGIPVTLTADMDTNLKKLCTAEIIKDAFQKGKSCYIPYVASPTNMKFLK